MFSQDLLNLAQELVKLAAKNNVKIATAESCTGGLVSGLITAISGSSQILDCGLVTYSNEAKNKLLKVSNIYLEKFGAVSEEVANEMALGAIKNSDANLSVSITGIAGPNKDDSDKPVGLVYISSFFERNNKLISKKFQFEGNRDEIRNSSIKNAIQLLILQIENEA